MKKLIDQISSTTILIVTQYQVLKNQLLKIIPKLQPGAGRTLKTVLNNYVERLSQLWISRFNKTSTSIHLHRM